VVEQLLAQVILDALAEHAGQINEEERTDGLHHYQPAVEDDDFGEDG